MKRIAVIFLTLSFFSLTGCFLENDDSGKGHVPSNVIIQIPEGI